MSAPAFERWTGLPWALVKLGPSWRAVVDAGPPVQPAGGWSQPLIKSVPWSVSAHGAPWVQRGRA